MVQYKRICLSKEDTKNIIAKYFQVDNNQVEIKCYDSDCYGSPASMSVYVNIKQQ